MAIPDVIGIPDGDACQRTPWGVKKKRGVENLTNDTPPKRSFGPPFVRYVFHPPQPEVSVLCFSCTKIHDRADQKLFWRGPKIFGRARSLVRFPPPIRFAPPHITAQACILLPIAQDLWLIFDTTLVLLMVLAIALSLKQREERRHSLKHMVWQLLVIRCLSCMSSGPFIKLKLGDMYYLVCYPLLRGHSTAARHRNVCSSAVPQVACWIFSFSSFAACLASPAFPCASMSGRKRDRLSSTFHAAKSANGSFKSLMGHVSWLWCSLPWRRCWWFSYA